MTRRLPLVLIDGELTELPTGDTVDPSRVEGGGTTPFLAIDGGNASTTDEQFVLEIDFGGAA